MIDLQRLLKEEEGRKIGEGRRKGKKEKEKEKGGEKAGERGGTARGQSNLPTVHCF